MLYLGIDQHARQITVSLRDEIVSESTLPNSAWVEKQAGLFVDQTVGREDKPSIVMHDKDCKFTNAFADRLTSQAFGQTHCRKRVPI